MNEPEILAKPPENAPPTRIGDRYEVIEQIGAGGMGVVYKARHMFLDNIVAIKVLSTEKFDKEKYLRFDQEAKVINKLRHPNIVEVQDYGFTSTGEPYLVMEYVDGEPMDALLERRGTLPLEEALPIFRQICIALQHIHDAGVVHRDLKPSNVLVARNAAGDCVIKLADFGIAKQTNKDQKLTETGAVLGSPLYMSPEQNLGQPLDGRCDLYSLGCLMYETLTGSVPFKGTNTIQTLLKHLNEEPLPFATISGAGTVPAWMENIVLRCLSKNPNDRSQSAQTLLAELDKGSEGYSGKRVRTMRPRFRLTPKNTAIAVVTIVVMTLALLQLAPVRHQVQAGIARAKLSMVTRRNTDEEGMQSLITEGYQALHDGNIPVAKMYYGTVFALTDRTANSVARADAACGNIAATAIERYRNDEKKLFQFQFETLLQLIAETEKIPKEKRPEKFAGRLAFRAWKLEQSMPSAFQPTPTQLEQLVAPLLAVGANNRAGEILGEAGRRYAMEGNEAKAKECLDRVVKLAAQK